jgi:hypothetical protein
MTPQRPLEPSIEDVREVLPDPPQQSPGDADRPVGLDAEDGQPSVAAALDESALLADELDHEGLDVELGADQELPPHPAEQPAEPHVKDRPSKWAGPTV